MPPDPPPPPEVGKWSPHRHMWRQKQNICNVNIKKSPYRAPGYGPGASVADDGLTVSQHWVNVLCYWNTIEYNGNLKRESH